MCAPAKQTAVHKTKTLMVRAGMMKMSAPSQQRQPGLHHGLLESAGASPAVSRGPSDIFQEVF
jgi:hypothetical protein